MYETVKTVKGYIIERMVGSRRFFWVRLDAHRSITFHTIKAATEYIETRL